MFNIINRRWFTYARLSILFISVLNCLLPHALNRMWFVVVAQRYRAGLSRVRGGFLLSKFVSRFAVGVSMVSADGGGPWTIASGWWSISSCSSVSTCPSCLSCPSVLPNPGRPALWTFMSISESESVCTDLLLLCIKLLGLAVNSFFHFCASLVTLFSFRWPVIWCPRTVLPLFCKVWGHMVGLF